MKPLAPPSTLRHAGAMAVFSVLLLGSVVATSLAFWVLVALQLRHHPDASLGWQVCLAAAACVGVPFSLAVWKHAPARTPAFHTLTWLPLATNAFMISALAYFTPNMFGLALRVHGATLASAAFGDDATQVQMLAAFAHEVAERVTGVPEPTKPSRHRPRGVLTGQAIEIALPDVGGTIVTEVVLEGPEGHRHRASYLFDTGASYTTIETSTAKALHITVPDDAPTMEFATAAGPRQSRMVYLPALELGGVRMEGLSVSICDDCPSDRSVGLLGQNVMRTFLAQIDYEAQQMTLYPRMEATPANRAYDIEPMLATAIAGPAEVWFGRIRWPLLVHNRSTRRVFNIVPVVRFAGGSNVRAAPIAELFPGASARTLVEGPTGYAADHRQVTFTLGVQEASW